MGEKRHAGLVVTVAMLCVTALELYALSRGLNGVLLTGSIAAISAAAAGYVGYKYRKE